MKIYLRLDTYEDQSIITRYSYLFVFSLLGGLVSATYRPIFFFLSYFKAKKFTARIIEELYLIRHHKKFPPETTRKKPSFFQRICIILKLFSFER